MKTIFRWICSAVLIFGASQAFAVWVPETALQPAPVVSSDRPVLERLESDEQRLQQVLQDLKKDEAELKKKNEAEEKTKTPEPIKNTEGAKK